MSKPGRSAAGLRAVILAGGKGTRLKPFSVSFPKPLVPLGDTPVLDIFIRRLTQYGITDITLTLGHLVEQIKLRFIQEEKATGTAGSLALVPDLNETFLVANGDLLTNLDFHALAQFHRD